MRRIHATILILAALLPMGVNAQLSIPYAEDFNTMTNISGLTAQGYSYYGCTLSLYTASNYSCDGTKNLRFSGGGTTKNRVLVFPAFSQDISNLALVFNTRPEGTSASAGVLDVGYVTDTADTASFVALQTYSYSTFPNSCQLKECHFASAPTGARIALRNRPKGSAYFWFVDNIEVLDTLNLCHWPTSVGMTAIGPSSITLAAADSTGTTHDFRLSLDGTDMGVFFNQTTITNLTPNTAYTAVVQSVCGSATGAFPVTYNFSTPCSNTLPAPFVDDMESYVSGTAPECYTTVVRNDYGATFYPRVIRNAANAYSDTGYLRLQGLCNVISLPTVNLSADNMHVRFYMRYLDTTSGTLRAGVLTTLGDTASFVPLFTVPNHSTQYNEYEFWTDGIDADTAYVTFFWESYATKAAVFIDDITVGAGVGCRRPNATYFDSVDSASVSLSWTAVPSFSEYHVAYGTSADIGSATIVSGITSNTYTVTGLAPATDYWFWVRTVCDDTTDWQPMGSIRTACLGGLTAPTTITFDSLPFGQLPRCWTALHTPAYAGVQDEQYFGFGPVLQFDPSFGAATVVAMPHIYLAANNIRATVTAAIDNLDPATLELGYVTDLSSPASFVPLVNVTATTLTDYTFDTDTVDEDTLWIAFRSSSSAGQVGYAYISAISIGTVNGCHRPSEPDVDSVTDNSVVVSWHSSNATAYEVAIAEFPDIDSANVVTTSDTSLVITGLLPSTQYYVWLRSDCNGDVSEWTAVVPFRTMCDDGYCTINMHLVDNDYGGQLYNYAYVGVIAVVNGIPAALAGGPGTTDAVVDVNLPVCSTDSVAFIWIDTSLYEASGIFSSLSYSFTVGDGTVLAAGTGAGMHHGDVIYATAAPCPSCPTPLAVAIDNTVVSNNSLTLTWTPAAGSSAWLVSIDGATLDTIYDTAYTFTGLVAGTVYSLGVATVCDDGAASQFIVLQGATGCVGTVCELQVDMSSLHEYNVVWGGGNAVDVYAGNSLRGSASVPNGSDAATAYIPVCDGDSLTLLWHAGSNLYGPYCAFTAIAPGNDTLYSGTGSNFNTTLATAVVHCTDCLRPDSITVSAVGNTTATLAWNSTGAATYRLTVGDTVIVTAATTATVTGLTPSTSYSYLLQAVCNGGSSLATAGSFATACGPYPLPYFEDFDDTPRDQMPLCWTSHSQYPDYMGAMTPSVYRGASRARSGFNSLELASNGQLRPMAVSKPLTGAPANRLQITFWLNGATHTGFEAGLMTDPADTTTFVPLLVVPQATLNYSGYQFTTENATITDSVFHFALRYTSSLVMYNDIFLDDLLIRRLPDCSEEFTDVTVTNTTDSSATMTWDVSAGDNIGAYYTVFLFNANGDLADSISTYNDTLTIANLPPATSFMLCVKLICGGTESTVSDTVLFSTLGSVCTTPAIDSVFGGEDYITLHFSTAADTTELLLTATSGLSYTALTTADNYTFDSLPYGTDYTVSLRAHCNDGGLSDWVTSHVSTVDVDCGTPAGLAVSDITFNTAIVSWLAGGDETSWNVNVFNTFYDSTYISTARSLAIDGLLADIEYNVKVQALCGSHGNIPGPWSETLAFRTLSCLPVSNVNVSSVDGTSATVSWEAGANGNGTWLVEYGPAGFSRGEGESQLTSSNPYTITGLEPNSVYDVYVATVCDTHNTSVYSELVTFTTGMQGVNGVNHKAIMLYPNPASKAVTVACDVPAELTIIDQSGRTVLSTTLVSSTSVVDIDELPRGAYFVRLLNNQGTTVHKLIVK